MSESRTIGKRGLTPASVKQIDSIGYDPVAAAFTAPDGIWHGPSEGTLVEAAASPIFSNVRAIVRIWQGSQPQLTSLESHRNSSVWRADLHIESYRYHLARLRWAGQLVVEEAFGSALRGNTNSQVWSTRDLGEPLSPNGDFYVARILPTPDAAEQLLGAIGQGVGMPESGAAHMAQLILGLSSRDGNEVRGLAA